MGSKPRFREASWAECLFAITQCGIRLGGLSLRCKYPEDNVRDSIVNNSQDDLQVRDWHVNNSHDDLHESSWLFDVWVIRAPLTEEIILKIFGSPDLTVFPYDLLSAGNFVYSRENLVENLGTPVKTFLKTFLICKGTPVKTRLKCWQS